MSQVHAGYGAVDRTAVRIRRVTTGDVVASLREGLSDFLVQPSHLFFLCLVYPVMGMVIWVWTSGRDAIPLVFPLVSGFALVGPIAAVGLYEISRRRELKLETSWRDAFDVTKSGALWSIVGMGFLLLAIFLAWLFAAQAIYGEIFTANERHASLTSLLADIFTTRAGWALLIIGHVVGFAFAAVVLAISVVSLPLLLDRRGEVGLFDAVTTSVRATRLNAKPVFFFGLLVAVLLMAGSLPLFVGLSIVLPVLGHATWRLYRRMVAFPGNQTTRATAGR